MEESENCSEESQDLQVRHRKEKKELQSKVQALKKSAAKGDKKRKKEVLEEIAHLEGELEKKHSEELLQVKKSDCEANELTLPSQKEEENVPPRVSKAQRRRDKKATKEREREQLIKVQERENVRGARHVEIQKITKSLQERNLSIHEIQSDGNCLYSAVDHQLKISGFPEMGVPKLRELTGQFLLDHPGDFIPFLSDPDTGDLMDESQYKEYCKKVANTSTWGGEVELRALSHILKHPIEIIQATGPKIIIGEEYTDQKCLTLTYHRHMYRCGEHYNSVKFREESEDVAQA